jgi:hypothetical protein
MSKYTLPQLHPDLQPYLKDGGLHHPLVHLEYDIPALYQRVNQLYEYKKRTISHPEPPNEWDLYLPHLSESDRYVQFIINEVRRQDPEYFRIIGQIWTDFETLGQLSCFLEMVLGLEAFDPWGEPLSTNVVYMMTEIERQKLSQLPDEFTVYRGHDSRLLKGMSWTLERDIALQYAIGRNGGDRQISTGIVSKKSVIAFIDRWSESEIIVPTTLVRDIDTQSATKSSMLDRLPASQANEN